MLQPRMNSHRHRLQAAPLSLTAKVQRRPLRKITAATLCIDDSLGQVQSGHAANDGRGTVRRCYRALTITIRTTSFPRYQVSCGYLNFHPGLDPPRFPSHHRARLRLSAVGGGYTSTYHAPRRAAAILACQRPARPVAYRMSRLFERCWGQGSQHHWDARLGVPTAELG
jgi:hypothetical protein